MDLTYTPDEEAFRLRVRAWIAEHVPHGARREPEALRAWQRKLNDAGFLGSAWPSGSEYGSGRLTPMEQAILHEEMARADAPEPLGSMGLSWVGPAILRFGTDAQKRRFIPPLLRGDDVWATGYSEPNAGSDMYNTQTRAVHDGDDYVINGQKIWTSLAHLSNWYFLLVRTSSEGHKVAGLSLLLIPMQTPGIEIRPIRMINGDSEFSEVFLRDVRVPQSSRLGAENQGYEVVSSALINERSGIATGIRFDRSFAELLETARRFGKADDPVWRQRLAHLATQARIMNAFGLRVLSDQLAGRFNPHTSAAMKCMATQLQQEFSEAGMELQGEYGALVGKEHGPDDRDWATRYLTDRAMTIAGGTTEIQRNIVAERILGLPRS
ncbi:MAG TPA: acyl-CoA dehydrogenase family protein [Myxococcota bacterium]|nr:acyl-CoA dehydrogenase family protein [Myxococcota bacterium]